MNIARLRKWHWDRAEAYRKSADNMREALSEHDSRTNTIIKKSHENANFHIAAVAAIDSITQGVQA